MDSFRKSVGATIHVLVSAVEARDPYTAGHQLRAADLARTIAVEMGLSRDVIDGIRMAGSIHDIGKLSIPAEILSKPTKLTELEFSIIKEHSQRGYEMLKDVKTPWPLADTVHQHHERMNGSGYPENSKGMRLSSKPALWPWLMSWNPWLPTVPTVQPLVSRQLWKKLRRIRVFFMTKCSRCLSEIISGEGVSASIKIVKQIQ